VTLRSAARLAVGAAAAAVLLWLPFALGPSDVALYTVMGQSAIVAVGLSLLMGFAGQVSFGQGAFYALGAYVAGVLATKHGWPTLGALAVAPVFTAAVAAVVGVPLLRLRGHYLAFATLALHLILLALIFTWTGITGGQNGLLGVPSLHVGTHAATGATLAAWTWGAALLLGVVGIRLVGSRAGRALQAIATSEAFAAASGVNVARYKLQLFVLSAGYAGFAGGLFTFYLQYLSPDSFPITISVEFVVMAAFGGMGTVWGAVVGAVAIEWLRHELQNLGTNATLVHHFPSLALQLPTVLTLGVYGSILVVVMLFLPRGIVPSAVAGARRLLGPASAHEEAAVDVEGGPGDVAGVG
jgi:branched-chain amino acid transport system permease protein